MAENYTIPDPRLVEHEGEPLIAPSFPSGPASVDNYLDSDWAKASFLMSDLSMGAADLNSQIDPGTYDDIQNRYRSSASRKFTDTQIGGNAAVNARPQFNTYTDVPDKGRLRGRNDVSIYSDAGNYGMGRYYSEAIDDNAQTIYLRFGVPQYSSLYNFFTNAFDPTYATLVNTGRRPGALWTFGKIAGTFFTLLSFPVLTMAMVGTQIISKFFSRATSKFYTMKPTMYLYWAAVDMLVNSMVVNRGLAPKFPGGQVTSQRIGDPFGFDSDFINIMHEKFPRIFSEDGRVDIFAVALRAQAMANKLFQEEYKAIDEGDPYSFLDYVRKEGQTAKETLYVTDTGDHKLTAYLAHLSDKILWFGTNRDEKDKRMTENSPKVDPNTGDILPGGDKDQSFQDDSYANDFRTFLEAEMSQGGAFAVFRVDSTGSTSESFSNAVAESDISSKLNGMVSQGRQLNFSLAGGNLGDGMIANAIEGFAGGVKDLLMGTLSGISLGLSDGLLAALSGSYYDIPKTWQSSSAQLPRASYSMQLICPYGHPFSQLQNIYIPLAMLLAGVLPRSTGKQSYGSPFLCQLYDRGRAQIQLGMIESLSISRGTSNLAFTNKGQALALDVSLNIVDLSSIMHMPMGTGTLWDTLVDKGLNNPAIDEDNILYDYLAVVSGLDMYNQIYPLPRARLKAAQWYMQFGKFSSPAWSAMAFHDQATSGILSYTPVGWAVNVLELGAKGSGVISGGMAQ